MRFALRVFALALLAVAGSERVYAVTVTYTAGPGLPMVFGIDGQPLPIGTTVMVGVFEASFDPIDPSRTILSLPELAENFRELDRTEVRAIGGDEAGRFARTFDVVDASLDGRQLYLVPVVTSDLEPPASDWGNVTAYGIFTGTDPSWIMPAHDALPIAARTTVNTRDINLTPWGFARSAGVAVVPHQGSTSYTVWRTVTLFGSGLTSEDLFKSADPDGDGRRNLLEYALGSDPLVIDPPLRPELTDGGVRYSLVFRTDRQLESIDWRATPFLDTGYTPVTATTVLRGTNQREELRVLTGDQSFGFVMVR